MKEKTILLREKKFSGKGKKVIWDFINGFQSNLINHLVHYAQLSKDDLGVEHLFWHGEQQLKTAITTALSELCDGYIMQEPGVKRKIHKDKGSKEDYTNGRVDYWCRFGKSTRLSILVEVKHAWIRYYSPDKWTMYKYGLNRHLSAIKQIRAIEKKDFIDDNLYGVALTVLPMFTRYKSIENDEITVTKKILKKICSQTLKLPRSRVHASGGFVINKNLQEIFDYSGNEEAIYESYPGVIFLWSIYKISRK